MEVISLAKYAYSISYFERSELDKLWKSYWNGGGNIEMELPNTNSSRIKFTSGEIFEYLIEGALVLID